MNTKDEQLKELKILLSTSAYELIKKEGKRELRKGNKIICNSAWKLISEALDDYFKIKPQQEWKIKSELEE